MPITKIEEKESPNETKCWLKVIVIGKEGEDEKKVFAEGKRIRWVLRRLEKALGFKANNGLPVKANPPFYFFIVECLSKNKDRTKETIREIVEASGETHYAH
ncbi:MAG: hypothetical protein A2V69_01835 [Candidatus Portnoybacteria bacterium RBG_13_40_8]|uniref:Uncharacterized protein n=1 Tax=Candidatus Portnoybacteria bacterium RBG_13_40_8 TaxID=1801990 RepID=A0A1G2F6C7_9BACT|nr:MAG: hypothetical protein A2V69_01835 [Candidatus Portnoybacteria bacterium RBG_13_40_8]OGZ34737.1 MAG: hypothetical protein A2V60_02280 [Candidatus Portnoybacteria bacterium RIFCSPHIGHO2_01_FULL_39_19]